MVARIRIVTEITGFGDSDFVMLTSFFGYSSVDVFSGLLCRVNKVKLFHLCMIEFAAGIFKR